MGAGRTRPVMMSPELRRRIIGLHSDWKPLKICDDPIRGIVNIEGIDYSYDLFRSLAGVGDCALMRGDVFTLVERENGMITVRRLDDTDPRRVWFA